MTFERAIALLSATPLVDGHNDLPWALRKRLGADPRVLDGVDVAGPLPGLDTDLPRLRAGRVGAQFWSVYVSCDHTGDAAVTAVLEQIAIALDMIERYPADLRLARTADEAEAAFAAGRVASLLGAEGGHCIAGSLGVLRSLYRLGVRYMTLTHNKNTPWADSATDEPAVGGLSPFGVEVVEEMNRLGMLVDLSHVAATTMHDALDATAAPVVFSHSGCRAVNDHPRNVPDDVLRRLPANGGVCMVNFVPPFLTGRDDAAIGDVVAHLEHLREVAGIDHVGIGSDFDGSPSLPEGLDDVSRFPALFQALLDRGWSEDDCAKAAGRNALRVLRGAERCADEQGADEQGAAGRCADGNRAVTPG
ncbi:dipeptidase [Actinomadura verrucosospora]|uniref:Membrane dipeptidase n=1 Tax=Actinomadura verrucosospora TaxID=46165 RepID=A0A7D4A115_ACTVE|nr:dipeptidase [Actinomadura verrucosospora]QKG19905.1 membrane dipeptidase [Actinomadura verrucosospora]